MNVQRLFPYLLGLEGPSEKARVDSRCADADATFFLPLFLSLYFLVVVNVIPIFISLTWNVPFARTYFSFAQFLKRNL